jgi:hypothetical protein
MVRAGPYQVDFVPEDDASDMDKLTAVSRKRLQSRAEPAYPGRQPKCLRLIEGRMISDSTATVNPAHHPRATVGASC